MEETLRATRSGHPSSHLPIRAERPTLDSHTLPLSQDETIATTTRDPTLGARAARVVERARERDMVAETHFQSNLSHWTYWHVAVSHCHAISHNINTVLLQCAPNLFNLLLVHATNANATVNLAVTVLHNFELKRDTVQTKNDFPAQ